MNAEKSTSLVTGSIFLLAASLVFSFTVIGSPLSFAEESTGSIKVSIKFNTTYERLDTWETILKVFQDNDVNPYVIVGFPDENPVLIDSLPLGHKYKVEVYVNNMLSGVGSVKNLQNIEEDLEILIPAAGGVRFTILYDDGETGIEDAKFSLKSDDEFQWRLKTTDEDGNTGRLWLASNNNVEGYYKVEVSLGENLVYEYSPVIYDAGEYQKVMKIVTPWPKLVEDLITVSIYNGTQKVSKSDGNFVVELYDKKDNKVAQSFVNYRGDAFFSNLKVGSYSFVVSKLAESPEGEPKIWEIKSASITGKEDQISIFKTALTGGPQKTCNCVAFRLDDVQDFYLNSPQTGVMKLFQGKNVPLSIGIIGGFIGLDSKIVDLISSDQKRSNPALEIVSHSWNNSPLTNYDKKRQLELLTKTDAKIFDVFGVSPSVFIPPENLLNNVTLTALEEIHYTHVTGHTEMEIFHPTPLENQTVYYFPATTETASLNDDTNLWDTQSNETILARIQDSLNNYGYAVVMMHPYEFSVSELGIYTNEANQQQLDQTSKLIDRLRSLGITIVPLGQINQDITKFEQQEVVIKPEDSQIELSCNCVAFRLVTIQDYWLDDVQIGVINTFLQKGASVTAGIIGNLFGYDAKLVDYLKDTLEKNEQSIEIANNGWDYEDFTSFTMEEQSALIKQGNDRLSSALGKTPSVFIPPLEKFNDATISALHENNMRHISSSVKKDPPPYQLSGLELYHFPGGPSVGKYDPILGFIEGASHEQTLSEVQTYLDKYGFAVVTLQPQEFSVVEKNAYTNQVDQQQIQELELLIDKIQAQGLEIVPIGQISQDIIKVEEQDVIEKPEEPPPELQSCNCVAFTFVTVQDYFLNDPQIEVIDTFIRKGASVTTGIIGNAFGYDAKLVDYLKDTLEKNEQSIEIANNGWDYEDFTSFTMEEQSALIKQGNDRLSSALGKTPSVFIPPFENFNDATISALRENNINHISSSPKKDPPPYQLSGSEFYHFPRTAAIGKFDPTLGVIKGVNHEKTLAEVLVNLEEHGFAVVSLQPQEFSVVENKAYTNQVNQQQIQELESLIDKIQAQGLKIVPVSKINLDSAAISVPVWIKNNAGWWASDQIEDSDFVSGIQWLINKGIMKLPPTAPGAEPEVATEIPDWIKNNAGWWADGLITDTDFVSGIQWLITNGIIKISAA